MHLNSEWYKPEISRKDLKNLAKRKDLPGILHMIIYFASLGISGYLAYYFIDSYLCLIFFLYMGLYGPLVLVIGMRQCIELLSKQDGLMKLFTIFHALWVILKHIDGDGVTLFIIQILIKLKTTMIMKFKLQDQQSLLAFFLNFIPFADLLFPHKLLKYEIIKHSFRKFSPVIAITASGFREK